MWYYLGPEKQQQGPVDENRLKELMASGNVTDATLVWREGMAEWKPYGSLALSPGPAAGSAATCQVCGKTVGSDNLIELAGLRTCAECKPKALQALTEGKHLSLAAVWRSGKMVVAMDGAHFPARCVKCNKDGVEPPLKRKLYWHHPAIYLLVFFQFIIYIIVAVLVRQTASVEYYLCPQHLQRRKYFVIAVWLSLTLGFAALIAAVALSNGMLAIATPILLIVAVTLGAFFVRPLGTRKIRDKTIWLGGAGKEFLESLPVKDE